MGDGNGKVRDLRGEMQEWQCNQMGARRLEEGRGRWETGRGGTGHCVPCQWVSPSVVESAAPLWPSRASRPPAHLYTHLLGAQARAGQQQQRA